MGHVSLESLGEESHLCSSLWDHRELLRPALLLAGPEVGSAWVWQRCGVTAITVKGRAPSGVKDNPFSQRIHFFWKEREFRTLLCSGELLCESPLEALPPNPGACLSPGL